MTITRRSINTLLAGVPLAATLPSALAQSRKDAVVLGMVLEPTSLDPTTAAAAAIGEIVHYNVLEGLTKIAMDGAVTPLLADAWFHTPDGKTYTF
ncbi:MAG: ABC transporter substrate-binding protein, partial [Rubrivivax sp.]|nr:ABC transporter substrate-binding protein [Rubrivivax sp.]